MRKSYAFIGAQFFIFVLETLVIELPKKSAKYNLPGIIQYLRLDQARNPLEQNLLAKNTGQRQSQMDAINKMALQIKNNHVPEILGTISSIQ
jgi:hypothetical protein